MKKGRYRTMFMICTVCEREVSKWEHVLVYLCIFIGWIHKNLSMWLAVGSKGVDGKLKQQGWGEMILSMYTFNTILTLSNINVFPI